MLITIASSKGAPGATSAALVLAAVWPRPVVLIEADPAGGDLALRCRSASGGPLATTPNLLGLAAAVRGSRSGSLFDFAQRLACGVQVIQGVSSLAQGRGLSSLWGPIVEAGLTSDVDVITDLGRLDRTSATLPLAAAADWLLVVGSSSLESVIHTRETLVDLAGEISAQRSGARLIPMIVGLARHARADRNDVDQVMAAAGVLAAPSMHLPLDRPALTRLEDGESASGRLAKTVLIRGARVNAEQLALNKTLGVTS